MLSRANYCCTTWAAWEPRGNKVILKRLQAVCNKFFRLIFNLDHTDSVKQLLKSHNILDIFQNYDFQVGQVMHKAIHGELPLPLEHILSMHNTFFYFTQCRIKQTQKSIAYAGPNVWNSLRLNIQDIQESDFNKFKVALKQYILNR